jgi:hypothetical protein
MIDKPWLSRLSSLGNNVETAKPSGVGWWSTGIDVVGFKTVVQSILIAVLNRMFTQETDEAVRAGEGV